MPEYTFGLWLADPVDVDRLAAAGLSGSGPAAGWWRVRASGRTTGEAARLAVDRVGAAGATALRADAQDWLTLAAVAERIGRARETVRLWAVGRVGPAGFPPPVNPGQPTQLYSWAELTPWLRDRAGLPVPPADPTVAAVNLLLQARALAPRVPGWRSLAGWLLGTPGAAAPTVRQDGRQGVPDRGHGPAERRR